MAQETNKAITSYLRVGQEIATVAVHASSLLWMAVVGIAVWAGKDVISLNMLIFISCFALVSMSFLILIEAIVKRAGSDGICTEETAFLEFQTFKLGALRWWGKIFRTLFIFFVGVAGYNWIDPKPIGDTPILDLPMKQFFSNLFAFLLVLGCIVWFLRFPNNKNHEQVSSPTQSPYILWGAFGIVVVSLGVGTTFLAYPILMMLQEATK